MADLQPPHGTTEPRVPKRAHPPAHPSSPICFAAAKWETAAPFFNAGLAGTVDVCLGFPALTAQLAKFGWVNNGTWCPQTGMTATWYPLKRQVRGMVALGGSAHTPPRDMVPPGATDRGRPKYVLGLAQRC